MKTLLMVLFLGLHDVLCELDVSVYDLQYCFERVAQLSAKYVICTDEQYVARLVYNLEKNTQRPLDPRGAELTKLLESEDKNATEMESCACVGEGTNVHSEVHAACDQKIFDEYPDFLEKSISSGATKYAALSSTGHIGYDKDTVWSYMLRQFLLNEIDKSDLYETLAAAKENSILEAKSQFEQEVIAHIREEYFPSENAKW